MIESELKSQIIEEFKIEHNKLISDLNNGGAYISPAIFAVKTAALVLKTANKLKSINKDEKRNNN